MPQHKSVKKQVRINKKLNFRNRQDRSHLKTAIRTVLQSRDKKSAQEALQKAVSIIDKSVDKGLIHKNNASNKKSRLSAFIQKLNK